MATCTRGRFYKKNNVSSCAFLYQNVMVYANLFNALMTHSQQIWMYIVLNYHINKPNCIVGLIYHSNYLLNTAVNGLNKEVE